MSDQHLPDLTDQGVTDEIVECARAVEAAVRQLCRLTINRPTMLPADVDVVLAHLADATAALPQATDQLGDVLGRGARELHLQMDALTGTHDPAVAVDTARFHLEGPHQHAFSLYRDLNAARNQVAHIATVDAPERRQPPPELGRYDRGVPR